MSEPSELVAELHAFAANMPKISNIRSIVEQAAARIETLEKVVGKLIPTAGLLYANSKGCVQQHHGQTETPPWLADCWRDITAAQDALSALSPQGEGRSEEVNR